MYPVRSRDIADFDWDDGLYDLSRATGLPAVTCYPVPYPVVVAGRGTKIEEEIRMDQALKGGVPVLKRQGGGCSVFMDPGCVIVSVVYSQKGIGDIKAQFDRCTQWLIQGLDRSGVRDVQKKGISDLAVTDRKIGGSCLRRTRDQVYFSAVLLVNCDIQKMDQYLCHPPREPSYRRGRPHQDFVANLNRFSKGITTENLKANLTQNLDPMARPA